MVLSKRLLFLMCCFLVLQATLAHAQQNSPPYTWRLSATGGPYLPSDFPGVIEIMKTVGARATFFNEKDLGLEMWLMHAAEDGAAINYGGLSVIKDLNSPSLGDVHVLIIGGLHAAYYRQASRFGRMLPYRFGNGIHLGAALLVPISGQWFFRGGGMVLNTPGMCAWVEVGLQYNFAGGSTTATP